MNKKALVHLKKVDPVLYEIAKQIEVPQIEKSKDYFFDLVDAIISQQLSEKAGATILARFKKLFPREKVTPQMVLKIDTEKIRQAGISYSKIKYIKGLAEKVVNKEIILEKLDSLSEQEVIEELVKIKGIGPWTAEMFLMFSLAKPDIFSAGDLGLKNAIIRIYKLKGKPTEKKLLKISLKWSPHRSYASRILWRSLNLKGQENL